MPGESDAAVAALTKKIAELNAQVAQLQTDVARLEDFYSHCMQEHLLHNFTCKCVSKGNR